MFIFVLLLSLNFGVTRHGPGSGAWWLARDDVRVLHEIVFTHAVDLFGVAIVEFSWGRIGTRGQRRKLSFADPGRAKKFVEQLLRRRASSQNRIGVCYREVFRGP